MPFTNTDLNQSIKTSNKKVLTFLPSGIKTTPAWLFEEFTSSSLAKHGIRRLLKGHRTYNLASDEEIDNIEYMIQLADSDLADSDSVLNISKDTPITYLGFGKWKIDG